MSVQRNIKKATVPVYFLDVPVSENNTFPIQFRVRTQDGSKVSAWSNVYEIDGPAIDGGDALTLKVKTGKVNIAWEDDNNRILYDVFVHRFADIALSSSRRALVSRPTSTTAQVTLYRSSSTGNLDHRQPHNLKVGMRIVVSGFAGTDYNIADTYVTSVPDPYTFVYSPVPSVTVNATPTAVTAGTIAINASTPDILTTISNYNFVFAGRTNKNTHSVNIGNVVSISPDGTSISYAATDIWCLVQAASANRTPNNSLDIATGHLAIT
jgi:hypothetical protein